MSTPTPETIGIDQIPGPKGLPYLGNLLDIDRDSPVEGFMRMAREYGPIYRLSTPAGVRLMVSDPGMVDEICDDEPLRQEDRGRAEEHPEERRRARAVQLRHRKPPVASRALDPHAPVQWAGHAGLHAEDAGPGRPVDGQVVAAEPDEDVDVPADMTSLTLDTIALCGFGYRFNSFYRETPHPFVAAMMRSLNEAQTRATKLPIQNRFRSSATPAGRRPGLPA